VKEGVTEAMLDSAENSSMCDIPDHHTCVTLTNTTPPTHPPSFCPSHISTFRGYRGQQSIQIAAVSALAHKRFRTCTQAERQKGVHAHAHAHAFAGAGSTPPSCRCHPSGQCHSPCRACLRPAPQSMLLLRPQAVWSCPASHAAHDPTAAASDCCHLQRHTHAHMHSVERYITDTCASCL